MSPEEFKSPRAGRLVKTAKGNWAFVPAALPPELAFDTDLVYALSRADAALAELSGLGRQLPNPHLLIAPYTKREALLSSQIEGTQASLDELFIEELAPAREIRDDVREVGNYIRAMEHGLARLPDLPVSLRLVRELHGHLMRGVRGQQAAPGEFRRHQNFIGRPGATEETATFIPPPVPEMHAALDAWEKFLHDSGRLPDLVVCGLIHAQFETIHPFGDGNGRVGRLLVPLFLMARGRLSQPLLYLSAFIEAYRNDYYTLLQKTRTEGDWRGWLEFFLAGVSEVSRDAMTQAGELLALRERWRHELRDRPNELALVDALMSNPYTTIQRASETMQRSYPTARNAIESMVKGGYLSEITGRKWGKLYGARPVIDIIDRVVSKS